MSSCKIFIDDERGKLAGASSSLETVSTPTMDPVGGTYSTNQSITISTITSGATIYYTEDGTTPTTSSSVYSSPLSIVGSQIKTIKAFAVKEGMSDSAIASE